MYLFDYQRPDDIAAATAAMQEDARYLAGGQSLIQAMKLRLSASERLVDLGALSQLKGISVDQQQVIIGSMTTHAAVAASEPVRQAVSALSELAGGIGDRMVRNMGTIGGSLANADPAACYPAAVLGLGAKVHTNHRVIEGDAFFSDLYETALQPGELITSIHFNIPRRAAYIKFKQPASRFALVGVFVSEGVDGVRVGVTGAKNCVFRFSEMEQQLTKSFTAASARSVSISADGLNADLHATSAYRAHLIPVLTARAVAMALGT